MSFTYNINKGQVQCSLCGSWMKTGSVARHLTRVHDYDEMASLVGAMAAARDSLATINREIGLRFVVAPEQ